MNLLIGSKVPEGETGQGKGFAVHGAETIRALKGQGITFDESKEPDAVLHIVPAFTVKKVEGYKNILYTAWEAPHLSPENVKPASEMDAIFGVSEFCSKVFKRYIPRAYVRTVPLGVDTKTFSFFKRKKRDIYTFLWVGAPNFRKGWKHLLEVWKEFRSDTTSRLYVKTARPDVETRVSGNVVIDTRHISKEELAQIYHASDCFLFPSFGEGFGLPLAEAMATGLPCLYIPFSGVVEFCNSKVAFPMKYNVVPITYGSISTIGSEVDIRDMIYKMNYVKSNYKTAQKRGNYAAKHIKKNFTWTHTGKKMKKALEDFLNE